jgi:hypothetical protein
MEESDIHHSNLNPQYEDSKQNKIPLSIRKKRKLIELQQQHHDSLSSEDSDEEDIDVQTTALMNDASHRDLTAKFKRKIIHTGSSRKDNSAVNANNNNSIMEQYKLAKAQLQYILRENEMLCDEWTNTEKKLKRLKTERRILLDALVKKGYYTQND